jgi:hypothetical protein
MKKLLVGLAAAATAFVIAAPTGANITDLVLKAAMDDLVAWDAEFAEIAPTASPAADHQFVAGSQKVTQATGNFQHVRVSAHSGPAGVDPKGSVRVTFDSPAFPGTTGDVKGDVVCLDVNVNQARVAALLRQPHQGFTHVTLIIFDNGNPGPTMGQSPDVAFIGFTSSPPATCANFGTTLIGDASGNLVVKDDTP